MGRSADKPRIVRAGSGALLYRFTYRPAGAARGVRVKIAANTSSEREAARRMTAAVAEWVATHPDGHKTLAPPGLAASGQGFAEAWGLFVEDHCLDPRRGAVYKGILEKHGELLARSFATVEAVTPLGVQRHVRDRRTAGRRSTTIRHEIASLKVFLGWLRRRGMIAAVPEIELPPRDDRDAECLSPEEVQALLDKIPVKLATGPTARLPCRVFFAFTYYQGLRDRTVCSLTWADYNAKTGELTIRPEIDKNKYGRTFVVFDESRAILDAMRPHIVPPQAPIFGFHKRWACIKRAAKEAAFVDADGKVRRISEHTLRHSRTTELLSRPDADVLAVAFLLGWKDVKTMLERYAHPTRRAADRFTAAVNANPQGLPGGSARAR